MRNRVIVDGIVGYPSQISFDLGIVRIGEQNYPIEECQFLRYTGFTDKKKAPIYEGDTVRCELWSKEGTDTVSWNAEDGCWMLSSLNLTLGYVVKHNTVEVL